MNITKFDVGMLFSLSLFVIIMSFAGPAFGLTAENSTTESEIPNLSVGQNTFDVAGDFPEKPGNPSQGELVYTENTSNGLGVNQEMITGTLEGTNNGIEVFVSNDGTSGDPKLNVTVNDWDNGNVIYSEEYRLSSVGDTARYANQTTAVTVEFTATNITTNAGNGNTQVAAEFKVIETPSDQGIISNLPIIGGIASGASDLAGIVGWIGSVLFYLFILLGETILNVITILVDVTVYLITMVSWMFSTYLGVVDGAPGWSRVIVAVPGVLLAGVLSKFVAVGISLLPTT